MVKRVDGVAVGDQSLGDMFVPSRVLAQAVHEHDDGGRRIDGAPPTAEQLEPADGGQRAAAALDHGPCSAHGTRTASSVGESRATTYSAGSESDTFSTMWVTRGGTYSMSPGVTSSSCSSWSLGGRAHRIRTLPESM